MSQKKILVVDDSLTSLMWERMILDQGKYEVMTARNGQQGFDLALAELPDLILMDVEMPVMDGIEALRALQANRDTRSVPVIMMTTPSGQHRVPAAVDRSYRDSIAKPVDKGELLAKVRNLIGD